MAASSLPEVWLRGPIDGISPYLQPVAHALLEAKEEVAGFMNGFPDDLLWERPAGVASPGFHLQHLRGVLDRLFTYAEGNPLSPAQLEQLKTETKPQKENVSTKELVAAFQQQVDLSVARLKSFDEPTLTAHRGVGRAHLPSTVLGLLFHSAEHTMRHTGQLLVTAKLLKGE